MLSSPKKTNISFVSRLLKKRKLANTHETHPYPFTMYREKVVRREYNLGTTKYLVPRRAYPNFCRMRRILYQSPPARKILMYVLFAFTFHIPVHTAVLSFLSRIYSKGGAAYF